MPTTRLPNLATANSANSATLATYASFANFTNPRRLLARLHGNDRGNLGVLLLLTVWSLVALIGLVWNTGEYATRRRNVQTAADSAAHAGNLWVSRTTNVTAATNLVISENGSAEVILRSVPQTHKTIQDRFDSERKRALQLRDGDTPNKPESGIPDCEYFEELLGFAAWSGNGRGEQRLKDLSSITPDALRALARVLPLVPAPEQARLMDQVTDHLRRNDVALTWLVKTWVGGAPPPAGPDGQPSQPAAPDGGLRKAGDEWITQEVRPRLQDILKTLDQEQATLDRWVNQTNPGVNATTPEELRQKRDEIFDYQQQVRDKTPDVVDQQRSALSSFYKCDLTYATPGHASQEGQPAALEAPVQPADDVPGKSQADGIRQKYPDQAEARFHTSDPTVHVDPINVNVGHAVIWHPGTSMDAPPGIMLDGKEFTGTFHIGGGEWGRVPCAPLSRYFNDRVSRDEQGLRPEPQEIDQTRSDLRGRVYPPPKPPRIPTLPQQIPDPKPRMKPIPIAPEAVGSIPTPDALTAAEKSAIEALNTRIQKYNSDVRTYVSDLRGLQGSLQQMYNNLSSLAYSASQQFADQTWLNYVEQNRAFVLMEMGTDKQFMVLRTYALRQIPDWAQSGMHDSVHQYVYKVVYNSNLASVTAALRAKLLDWAYPLLLQQAKQAGAGKNAAQQARSAAQSFANQNANSIARDIVDRASDLIAREVADEWVRRPWPFEITPPENAVPPTAGLTDDDRQKYFTSLAAAKTTDGTGPHPFLKRIFVPDGKPFVAFAQGENFNWMEYNADYGAGDAFDQISHYGHGDMGGSPRPWRLSTTGGWNWQPRLPLSHALGKAVHDGPDFRDFLNQGGVTSDDPDAFKTLSLH